jgi:hypothetical protein
MVQKAVETGERSDIVAAIPTPNALCAVRQSAASLDAGQIFAPAVINDTRGPIDWTDVAQNSRRKRGWGSIGNYSELSTRVSGGLHRHPRTSGMSSPCSLT